jgi:hypothetical protein
MKPALGILAAPLICLSACTSFGAFERADGDRDGRISADEATASEDLKAVFASADGDRNGVLDPTEFALAEQLIAGWKAAHAEAGGDHGGASGHSH